MTHHFEYFDFSHGGFLGMFLFVSVFELFDGYEIFLFHISALQYNTICSLADGWENLVFLHYILFLLIFNNIFLCNIINLLIRRIQICVGKISNNFLLESKSRVKMKMQQVQNCKHYLIWFPSVNHELSQIESMKS